MTKVPNPKITVSKDIKNGQEYQSIVLKEPVLDTYIDERELFLASNI